MDLPTEFDLIVIGTGLVESVVAAAASRVGKRVLHIDSNDYYGDLWTSVSLDAASKLTREHHRNDATTFADLLNDGERYCKLANTDFKITDSTQTWHVPDSVIPAGSGDVETPEPAAVAEPTETMWTKERLLSQSRRFNIDVAPKLHFARGDFVELLISSNIARYSEFRSVSRVLTFRDDHLEVVPCSRSDVFSSTQVSVIEKRMLMKLLTSCIDGDESEFLGYENKTFKDYLKDRKLTDNIIHYVLYAIAMGTDETPCLEGVANTKRFLSSLGRFGKTPLLYSMYGSGEITQAFCRLCAVFGGVYALNQQINGVIIDEENACKGVICGNQRISTGYVIMNSGSIPQEIAAVSVGDAISRAVFITDRSVAETEKEHLTLLLFPPTEDKGPVTAIEVGYSTGTCPKELFMVHLITKQKVNPQEDFSHCVQALFGEITTTNAENNTSNNSMVLWSWYFTIPSSPVLSYAGTTVPAYAPTNMKFCGGPDLDLDYDQTITEAKAVFTSVFPGCEFLPRAPDPEEIILEDDNTLPVNAEGDGEAGQSESQAADESRPIQQNDLIVTDSHSEGL